MEKYITLFLIILCSCKVREVNPKLLGVWEKVEYGQVLDDGTEHLENVRNNNCPNDNYEFRLNGKHFVRNFHKMPQGENCKIEEYKRKYKIVDNHIIVNKGKYKYEIKDLTSNYLKLYLYQHEFSDSSTWVYIYKFVKK